MGEKDKRVPVVTIGLNSAERMLLETQFNDCAAIQVSHLKDWDLAILDAEVVLVGMDSDAGYEVLRMMKNLRGPHRQLLVTFSCDGQRIPLGVGELIANSRSLREPVPGFCHHLREILRNVNCFRTYAADETGAASRQLRNASKEVQAAAAMHRELKRDISYASI